MSVVPPARTRRWAGTEDARCDRGSSHVVDVGLLVIVGVRSNGGQDAAPPGLRRPEAGRRPAEGRCLDLCKEDPHSSACDTACGLRPVPGSSEPNAEIRPVDAAAGWGSEEPVEGIVWAGDAEGIVEVALEAGARSAG